MKKTASLLIALLLCVSFISADSFSVVVNSTDKYPAYPTGETDHQGRTQYSAADISLAKNDLITIYDNDNSVSFVISAIDPYGAYQNFTSSSKGLTCNVAGCYTFYIKLAYNNDIIYVEQSTNCSATGGEETGGETGGNTGNEDGRDYQTSVPSKCPDVMLQGFYWDSYKSGTYGCTKWNELIKQSSEIGAYFDLVWLPPSAKASGVGYIPQQYSNQNSDWGTQSELKALIESLHSSNTKVIADIVVNHVGNKSSWCDYYPLDFGEYGQFLPDGSWICKTDEVNTVCTTSCKGSATGNADAGYNGYENYGDARDWDHSNPNVQNMIKAYLLFLKSTIGYDGWRYDYTQGFLGKYIAMYNGAAKNYFSVTEFYNGDPNNLSYYLTQCSNNTLTFDFATKFTAFNQGIASGDYQKCKGAGLLGMGKGKYAVTFIDNHDTFGRSTDAEFCGSGNGMKYADKVLQANAYMLSMPGVPCVFYPHWVKHKSHIAAMILARKATGVHSESSVSDEAGSGYYKATITGTNGTIRLLLGPNSGYNTTPSGYTLADKGTNYAVYYKTNSPVAPTLVVTPGTSTFKDAAGIQVTMSTIGGTGTSTIYYTLDGSDPTTSSTKQTYSAPIAIKTTTTLKAYATAGGKASMVQTFVYTYKEPQTTPIRVRFWKPDAWSKCNLYAWSTGSDATPYLGKWPGTTITQDSEGWYSYQFSADIKEVNFIFNDGKASDAQQTSDLYTDEDVCYSWFGGSEKLEQDCQIPLAISNVEQNATFTIYPNPVGDVLYIQSENDIQEVQIYNLTGELVLRNTTGDTELAVDGLNAGMYLLRANTDSNRATLLFIKK